MKKGTVMIAVDPCYTGNKPVLKVGKKYKCTGAILNQKRDGHEADFCIIDETETPHYFDKPYLVPEKVLIKLFKKWLKEKRK